MARRVRGEPARGLRDDRVDVRELAVQGHPARLHSVEVEHLRDHPVQALRVLVDVGRVLLHLRDGELLVPHELTEPLDPRQRGAELVADDRHEVALRAVQLLQLRDRFPLLLDKLRGRERRHRLVAEQAEQPRVVVVEARLRGHRADGQGAEPLAGPREGDRERRRLPSLPRRLHGVLPPGVVVHDHGLLGLEGLPGHALAFPQELRRGQRGTLGARDLREPEHARALVPAVQRRGPTPEQR